MNVRSWMKKWTPRAGVVGCALLPGLALAQAETEDERPAPRTLVMVRLLDPLVDTVGVNVEHAVGPRVALAATVRVPFTWSPRPDSSYISQQRRGVFLEPGLHFYVSGRAPEGFWIGPHAEVSTQYDTYGVLGGGFGTGTGDASPKEIRQRTVRYGGSLRAGYSAVLGRGLALQVHLDFVALSTQRRAFSSESGEIEGGVSSGLGIPYSESRMNGWSAYPRASLALGGAF